MLTAIVTLRGKREAIPVCVLPVRVPGLVLRTATSSVPVRTTGAGKGEVTQNAVHAGLTTRHSRTHTVSTDRAALARPLQSSAARLMLRADSVTCRPGAEPPEDPDGEYRENGETQKPTATANIGRT